jgi:hypothetical protein
LQKQLLPIPLVRPFQHKAETGVEFRRRVLGELIVTPGLIEIDHYAPHSLRLMRAHVGTVVITRVAGLATTRSRKISGVNVNWVGRR